MGDRVRQGVEPRNWSRVLRKLWHLLGVGLGWALVVEGEEEPAGALIMRRFDRT